MLYRLVEGFMVAVSLRPKEWLRLTESGTSWHLMTPLLCHFIDEYGNSVMGIRQEELDATSAQAAKDISDTAARVHQFRKNSKRLIQ